jgi:hypothetical protein
MLAARAGQELDAVMPGGVAIRDRARALTGLLPGLLFAKLPLVRRVYNVMRIYEPQ